jgi:hypothetical protein
MDLIKGDSELASEMVVLLGRELRNARKTISELQQQLEQTVSYYFLEFCKYFLTQRSKDDYKQVQELKSAKKVSTVTLVLLLTFLNTKAWLEGGQKEGQRIAEGCTGQQHFDRESLGTEHVEGFTNMY